MIYYEVRERDEREKCELNSDSGEDEVGQGDLCSSGTGTGPTHPSLCQKVRVARHKTKFPVPSVSLSL
jgi:hypothetical protein